MLVKIDHKAPLSLLRYGTITVKLMRPINFLERKIP